MIKVNTQTMTAQRTPVPAGLKGLAAHTLQNLQSELSPVPTIYANIEFWPEVYVEPTLTDTQKKGGEVLTVDQANKVVSVTHEVVDKTIEEIAEESRIAAEAAAEALKMTGVEILGVMCSATGKDQAGLTAVAVGATRAQLAGGSFAPTVFRFENGAELTITPDNFSQIEAIWTPFRQSFFTP